MPSEQTRTIPLAPPSAPQPDQQTSDDTVPVVFSDASTISVTPSTVPVDFVLDATDQASTSSQTANHAALDPGYTLNEYTVEAVLGAGGFGITYLARDNNLRCQVAIKEYLPTDLAVRAAGQTVQPRTESDTHGYQLGLDRFLAETRVLASFRHPNIVRVNRFFEANHTAYMVMDYEHGKALRDWLAECGPVEEAEVKRMFLPLLNGLAVVHQGGVVHRDIKPANIYVRDADSSLVLLDFGAARETSGVASRSLTSIISPGYAPFEQYHARGAQGPWTDIYALGGVLYWLVTGRKPLEAPSRIKRDTMIPAVQAGAGRFSPEFLAAIDWAMNPDEEMRPRSVAEFRPVLLGEAPVPPRMDGTGAVPPVAASPKGTSSGAPPAPTFTENTVSNKGSQGLKFAAAGAALAAVVGALVFFAPPKSSPPTEPVPALTSTPPPVTTTAVVEAPASALQPAKPAAKAVTTKEKAKDKDVAAKPSVQAGGSMATLLFEIVPAGERGEVSVDGNKIGTAPPLKEFRLAPGKHKIEIQGNKPPHAYHYWVEVGPNEKKNIWAKFANEF